MSRVYKSSQLIESIKRKGMLPETNATFTEQDFLDFATEEIDLAILPLVLSLHEDYYLYVDRIPITQPNQKRYKIPHRAVGNKLKYVGVQKGDHIWPLNRIPFEDRYRKDVIVAPYGTQFFYIENDEIVLDTALNAEYLVLAYYLRPNALVPDDYMLRISSISGNTIIVDDGEIKHYNVGDKIDFISKDSPNKLLKIDVEITAINYIENTITINTTLSNVGVGDYLCFAEKTAIPQIPTELQSLLAQRVVARCLEALGSVQELQVANAKIAEIESKVAALIDNRVENNPRKVIVNKLRFLQRRRF